MDWIRFKEEENESVKTADKLFFGLTFLEARFGPLLVPTEVSTPRDFLNKFGRYLDADELTAGHAGTEQEWMMAWNFLFYSENLRIFRIGKDSITPTFGGGGSLVSLVGSMNSHLFVQSKSAGAAYDVWNSSNGAEPFVALSDVEWINDEPTFLTDQLFYLYAKYPGILGNSLKVSIYNYEVDPEKEFVFNWDSYIASAPTNFSVGDFVYNTSIGFTAYVRKVDGTKVWFENTSSVTLSGGEVLTDGSVSDTTVSFTAGDTFEENIAINMLFDRKAQEFEFYFVLTLDGNIVDSKILSLQQGSNESLYEYENQYVAFKVPDDYTLPSEAGTADDYIPQNITAQPLLLGQCDTPSDSEIANYLEKIKYDWFGSSVVIFCVDPDSVTDGKLIEISEETDSKVVVYNL